MNAKRILVAGAAALLQMKAAMCAEKPNIVFILADDLGYSDLGCTGSDYYETPNIDRLAGQGLRFTSAYACAANSAPSRACLMSGKYTPRHGVFTVSPSARGDASKRKLVPIENTEDLRSDFVTMAEALSAEGYACGHVGKWHLGDDADGTGPLSQGFVSNVAGNRMGSPASYFYPYCNAKKTRCHIGLDKGVWGEYLTDRLTSEAIGFIEQHKDGPFFLYLAQHAVHTPLAAPKELVDKYKAKRPGKHHDNPVYAAMIENLDMNVGRICSSLDSLGLSDNTIVVFFSDNGGLLNVTDNSPLRGGKGYPYEGGTRVPLIVRWPGVLEPGSLTDTPVTGVDFYPTFVNIAGGKPSGDLDGRDIFTLLDSRKDRAIFWHFPAYLEGGKGSYWRATPYSSIRMGDWKLIRFYETGKEELYNLKNDLGETLDLSEYEIKQRKRLSKALSRWLETASAPIPTLSNTEYVESVVSL